ncbi:MAG TPA: hypothetical protein VFZ79_04830 [Acidimicrobiales bacterium]
MVPGLIGPAAASGIEHASSWRLVFLALLPLVAVAAYLALPVLSRTAPAEPGGDLAGAGGGDERDDRRRDVLVLVAGVGLLLGGLGAREVALTVVLVAAGALPAVWAFLRLVPPGTVALQRGMPAAVAARGVLTFAFFGADAYVSLAVTKAHGAPTWMAGLALTAATLTWTAGSWVQQRVVVTRGPRWLVRRGFAVIAAGIGVLTVSLGPVPAPVPLTVLAWAIGGLGIGLAYAPISVTVLGTAAPGEEGRASASLHLTDVLGVALGTGLSGVFVALGDGRGWTTASSLTIAFLVTLAVAVAGAVVAGRLPAALPGVEAKGAR